MIDKAWEWLCLSVLVAAVAAGASMLFKTITADGQVRYCYIVYESPTNMPPVTQLWGFRPWRPDRVIGVYRSNDEAIAAAKAMECRFGVAP